MILFTGGVPAVHTSEGKYSLSSDEERTALIIADAGPKDKGEYTCRIMIRSEDEINVTHTVQVLENGKKTAYVETVS